MDPEALTADEFNSVVSAVTNAFGDPTRREIYLFARDAGTAGVTAGGVAVGGTGADCIGVHAAWCVRRKGRGRCRGVADDGACVAATVREGPAGRALIFLSSRLRINDVRSSQLNNDWYLSILYVFGETPVYVSILGIPVVV